MPAKEALNGRVTCHWGRHLHRRRLDHRRYTFKSRFEDGPGSNPEQLIAAAHAACFSMALSNILAQAGHTAESVHTDATVTLRFVDGAPTITKIDLATTGQGPRHRPGDLRRACRDGQGDLPGKPRARQRPGDHHGSETALATGLTPYS